MANHSLITTRRNFLLRASAVTAAGSVVALPIVTLESPQDRIFHHMRELDKAVREFYGDQFVYSGATCCIGPDHVKRAGHPATFFVQATPI